ncbi:MAG: hypothetical protein LAT65_05770 [Saccharospirillum sp.]|nr:hypothetical protein [Saccharospirillum sp.]
MANPWFRMYHEFATDPKVQMLSEADQRRYIMLLCLRCSNEGVTLQDDEVAFQLRISSDEFAQTKATLIEKGLIDEHCQPTAWDKRQFASDSSTARVRRHRKNKKQQEEQGGNVTVTPPDTDTDTDTDSDTELNTPLESPKGEANAERSESKPPAKQKTQKRKTRLPEDFTLTKGRATAALNYWKEHNRTDIDVRREWDKFTTNHKAKGTTMLDWNATWKTWYVNALEFSRGGPSSVVALPQSPQANQRQGVRASLRNISNTDW